MARRTALALLLGVVALHLAIRIPLLANAPWFTDEGIGSFCLTQRVTEVPRFARGDFAPPLHYMALSVWGEVLARMGWRSTLPREGVGWESEPLAHGYTAFIPLANGEMLALENGVHPGNWDEWNMPPLWAVRLSSLLVAVVVLLGAMAFTRWATGSIRMALGVGLLLAVSPHVARWDTVVRHYAPQTLAVLGVAASLWGIAAAKCLRARWWLLPALGFATLAALMTHFMAALFMPGLGLWLLLVNGKTHWRRTALAGATMIAALIVFGNLWGPSLREQLTRTGFEDSVAGVRFIDNFPLQPSLPQRLLASMDGQSMTLAIFPGWWMWGMNALLWIVMVGYLLRLIRSGFDRVDGLLLLWLFGAPAMVLLVNTIRPATAVYTWRHFMAASPAAAILFVRGFAWLLDRVRRSAAP